MSDDAVGASSLKARDVCVSKLSCLLQRVIAQQKRKEALQFHRQQSVDDSLAAANARMVSVQDSGHTFSLGLETQKRTTRTASRREREKASTDVLTTIHSMANSNSGGHDPQRSQSLGDSAFANQPPQLPERAENLSQDEVRDDSSSPVPIAYILSASFSFRRDCQVERMLGSEVTTAMYIPLSSSVSGKLTESAKKAMCSPDVWLYVVICR